MTETEFWSLIGQLDWDRTGDDDAVLEPVVQALSRESVADIEAFEKTLANKLFELDTERHAREIGRDAYRGAEEVFSVDQFLYARCCVVANGREFFDAVVAKPAEMPKDIEFEALLSAARKAYELKTGEEFSTCPTSVTKHSAIKPAGPPPNKRLKLAARVDWGMNRSSARRSLSAIR